MEDIIPHNNKQPHGLIILYNENLVWYKANYINGIKIGYAQYFSILTGKLEFKPTLYHKIT